MRWWIFLGAALAAITSTGCKGDGCSNDNDCKGDRVCMDGECIEPPMKLPGGSNAGAAVVPDPSPNAPAPAGAAMVVSVPPGTNNGRIRLGPSLDTPLVREVPNGTRVEVLETRDRWVRVLASVGGETIEGWMHKDIVVSPGTAAARPTCNKCDYDCLNKADSIRKSDPSGAKRVAAQVCNSQCPLVGATPCHCHEYGLMLDTPCSWRAPGADR